METTNSWLAEEKYRIQYVDCNMYTSREQRNDRSIEKNTAYFCY